MTDQSKQYEEPKRSDVTDVYGAQGNEGQYGQGQYDSEGKPDAHGPQAQRIHPDGEQKKKAASPADAEPQKKANPPKIYLDLPLD